MISMTSQDWGSKESLKLIREIKNYFCSLWCRSVDLKNRFSKQRDTQHEYVARQKAKFSCDSTQELLKLTFLLRDKNEVDKKIE